VPGTKELVVGAETKQYEPLYGSVDIPINCCIRVLHLVPTIIFSGRSADWSFHLGSSSYRRDVPPISAGGIAPNFGGRTFE